MLRGGKWTADDLHEYWRDPQDDGNRPEAYRSEETQARSEFLVGLAERVPRDSPVLEVGCNVGRNLEALRRAGYTDLTGIEISAGALEQLREHHPELSREATLINSPVEEAAPGLEAGHYGLVYTMAVLEHIHPASEWAFAELVRATGGVLITIEDERAVTWRHFPRDYRQVFEGLGMAQVEEVALGDDVGLGEGFFARVFEPAAPAR